MDQTTKLTQLRQRILQVLAMHADMPCEPAHITSRVSQDAQNETYRLIDHDPRKNGGTDYVVVELKLSEGKVWIQRDGIEYGIAEDLLEAGIPAEDIVEETCEGLPYALTDARAA